MSSRTSKSLLRSKATIPRVPVPPLGRIEVSVAPPAAGAAYRQYAPCSPRRILPIARRLVRNVRATCRMEPMRVRKSLLFFWSPPN